MKAFIVKSKLPPTVEIDTAASAAYVRFQKNTKVVKTVENDNPGPIITVDLDADGEVIGVELVGVKVFSIGVLLQKASIKAPSVDLQKTRYVKAPQMSLAEA